MSTAARCTRSCATGTTTIPNGMRRNAPSRRRGGSQPKWVVSRSLKSVGPNATLVGDDLEGAIRALKAERDGEIEVAGPNLARSLTELGLIDEYRIYLHPVVLGHGTPYFAGPRPPLRLVTHDRIGEDVIRLSLRSRFIRSRKRVMTKHESIRSASPAFIRTTSPRRRRRGAPRRRSTRSSAG